MLLVIYYLEKILLLVTYVGVLKYMAENPSKFDPRDYLKPAREAARKICLQRYQQFGCEGQAARIRPVDLSSVAKRYERGELAQTVSA